MGIHCLSSRYCGQYNKVQVCKLDQISDDFADNEHVVSYTADQIFLAIALHNLYSKSSARIKF